MSSRVKSGQPCLFNNCLVEIRQQLQFKDNLLKHVHIWKEEIKQNSSFKVIFIGVHCRRGDYGQHLAKTGTELVDFSFFDTAFEIYRKKYNNHEEKVIFLAVSDDVKWIKVIQTIKFL